MKLPNEEVPTLSPYWITNNKTGELTGFYIDYLRELFREINKNYTIDTKLKYPGTKTYDSLGKYLFCYHQSQTLNSF